MQQHLRSRLPVPVAVAAPVGGDAKRASIILYPFTLQVAQDVANALLYHFLRYHVHLGFHVVQYSQVGEAHPFCYRPGPPELLGAPSLPLVCAAMLRCMMLECCGQRVSCIITRRPCVIQLM